MKSFVSVSIWFGTSLKSVRNRLPARVSVATHPTSEVSEMTNGESPAGGSDVLPALAVVLEFDVGGTAAWAKASVVGARSASRRKVRVRTEFMGLLGVELSSTMSRAAWWKRNHQTIAG